MKKLYTIIISGLLVIMLSCNSKNSTDSKFLGTWQGVSGTMNSKPMSNEVKMYSCVISKLDNSNQSYSCIFMNTIYTFTKENDNTLISAEMPGFILMYNENTAHLKFLMGSDTYFEFEKLK